MRTKKTVCESCTSIILKLPSDLLVEILSRLPLKSLAQCKVVCKQWREILTDPCFVRIYLNNPPFWTFFSYNYHLPGLCMVEISETQECIVTNIKPILPKLGCLVLIGSCNGILCFRLERLIYIWNPMISGTDSIMAIPKPYRPDSYYCRECYIFGYSSAVNRFKILRILYYENDGHEVKRSMIFTIGVDDKWRRLPDCLFKNIHGRCFDLGVVLNGIYHYIMDDESDEGTKTRICTFDMGEEKQGVMSWPHTPSHKQSCVYRGWLCVLHDQLCLNEYDCVDEAITIWIMKEYGVMESWSKFCVFKDLSPEYFHPIPIAILDCGDVVLTRKSGSKLWLYSPRRRKHGKVEDLGIELITKMNIRYAPSFSPLGEIIKPGK